MYALCAGILMTILDTTIVAVAAPSIMLDLGLSSAALSWIFNSYMLAYGGFLILSGRIADLFGHRRIFLLGVIIFTAASVLCGSSETLWVLLIGRTLQGLAGAMVSGVGLALIMTLAPSPAAQARAMGVFSFVAAAGGGAGQVLGGLLTHSLNWHWIFLVNIPIGATVYVSCYRLLPSEQPPARSRELDLVGAAAITLAICTAVDVLVTGNDSGWNSWHTLSLAAAAAILLIVFLILQARVEAPIVPLHLFHARNFPTAALLAALWAGGAYAWLVIAALFLQRVLNYDPMKVGLAFAPGEMLTAIFSIGLAGRIVTRFGLRVPLVIGLLLVSAGLALFARAPIDARFLADILPGMLLIGLGSGLATTPLLLASLKGIEPEWSGTASGIVNTCFTMGGAFGLALLSSMAEMRSGRIESSGGPPGQALYDGYSFAFLLGAFLTVVAALIAAVRITSFAGDVGVERPLIPQNARIDN